jgi:mono/diheme cytochrome c family protein
MQIHHLFTLKLFAIASITACLVACGGGGAAAIGSDSASSSNNSETASKDSSSGESATEHSSSDAEHSSESEGSGSGSGFATSSKTATNAANGQALYTAFCASCHGASYTAARNYSSTLSAIARNKGNMGYLSTSIQTAQANDIATYLTYGAGTAPTTPTRTSQTISFGSPGDQTLRATALSLAATASSGLGVSITSSTPTVCSVSAAALNLLGVGTCTLTASQLGDAAFAAAAPVTVSFAVTAAAGPSLRAQTISFASPGNQMLGSAAPALVATASSNLPISFASATPSVCSVSGALLTPRQAGTCTLAANQAGDATYAAAATVSNSFFVVADNAAAGKIAYNQLINGQSCTSCHGVPGSQPSSLILSAANADVVLSSAITNNVGGMGVLNGLYTPQQLRDIAAYLATPGI